MPIAPGTILGPYQIDAPFGAGGMGEVYKATDTREARAVATLNHPSIGHRMKIAHITLTVLLGCLLNLTASAAEPQRGSAQQTESTLAEAARRAREAASETESDSSRVYSNDNLFPRARLTVGAARISSQDQARERIQPAREPLQEEEFEPALFLSGAPSIIPLMAVGGGQEWLRVSVNAAGTVTGIVPLLEVPGFSDLMQTAVRRWAFIPAMLNGEPTHSEVFVAAVFRPAALYTMPDFETPASSTTRGSAEFAFPTVAVVITGLAVWSLMRPTPRPPVRFAITLPTSDQLVPEPAGHSLALSPDGATLVYVATRGGVQQLYRRPLDQAEAVPLPGTEGANHPVFSPDGEWIGFTVSDGTLKRMALAGGPPATLYDGPQRATDPSWGTNDMIVFGFRGTDLPFMQVASTGGVAEPVTILAEGESDHRQPELLPGGTALLFTVASRTDRDRIAVKSLDTGERWDLLAGSTPRYVSSWHIVFARGNDLWAVPFNVDRLEVTGEAVPVLEGVDVEGTSGLAHFTLARNGSLAYIPGGAFRRGPSRTLVWVDREGREESVAAPLRAYRYLDISPDGAHVALDVRDQENDIWIWDLARETMSRLTLGPRRDRFPVWTPDGRQVVFHSLREGVYGLFWKAADGIAAAERLTVGSNPQFAQAFLTCPRVEPVLMRELGS